MDNAEKSAEDFDKLCNEGFRRLEQLRAEDKVKTPEYDETLKKLQEATRKRVARLGILIAPLTIK